MKCSQCDKPARWDEMTWRTLLGFSSPPGHRHDPNCQTRRYRCDDDHVTVLRLLPQCSVTGCEWMDRDTCNTGQCYGSTTVKEWP